MNVLFSSTVCSRRFLDHLYEIGVAKPTYNIQKFHRLILRGLEMNGVNVYTNTSIPCTPQRYKQKCFCVKNEIEDGVHYHYAFVLNMKWVRLITVFVSSFFYALAWCLTKKDRIVVCDALNATICYATICAAKLTRTKVVAILTDMPGLMVQNNESTVTSNSRSTRFIKSSLCKYDGFIFITEHMNAVLNENNKPYMVMEGLVDVDMSMKVRTPYEHNRVVLYAGGLFNRYGIKMLVDAFCNLSDEFETTELHLYGDGPSVPYIKERSKDCQRIVLHGPKPNDEIVEAELHATILVNPRPSHEDFAKYSFPSKNMEYMISGTPVLTCKLPGMPEEYYPYVTLVENETVEGMEYALRNLLSKTSEELCQMGKKAKEFMLENKSNIHQGHRIKDFLKKVQ